MSQRPDDESAQSDPLLLFATEPPSVAAPASPVEISKKIEPSQPDPKLDALLQRAETAERALRESRRDVAALKRELATLVSAAKDNRAHARRSAATLGLAAAGLLALVTIGWRFVPAAAPPTVSAAVPATVSTAAPPTVSAAAPATEPEVQLPAVETPQPAAPAAVSLPRREAPARAQPRAAPEPKVQYVGTLSIDAVPAGGEVFLNRRSVGTTPVRLTGLRAGSHLVWIHRQGYRRYTQVVLVPANQVSRVSVALEPETAPALRP